MGTNIARLVSLANPALGFVQKVHVAEAAIAGYTFAIGLVSAPPSLSKIRLTELPALAVSGAGTDREHALNRMMLEAVERNSCTFIGTEKLVEGRAKDIDSEQWRKLLLFSNRQLASRPVVPVQDPYWVGVSLSSKSLVRYCEADSLLDGKKILIPAAFVYLGYGSRDEPVYAIGDSNGCAAGESKSDATFRALLELIERDAFAIWWFNRIERTGLSFAHDELLCRIASSVEAEARSLRLYDLTSDLGVPVVAASIADEKGSSIYVGSAAGISEVSAARKAAIEALSFWFWGRMASEPVSRRKWLKEATLDNQPWLLPKHHRHLVSDEVIQFGDVRALTSGLIRAGCEPVVVDLTKDYFQISVVRVIAPGFRSHMPRFAPGRLFDVPVKQGWLSSARKEEELLPYPCPL